MLKLRSWTPLLARLHSSRPAEDRSVRGGSLVAAAFASLNKSEAGVGESEAEAIPEKRLLNQIEAAENVPQLLALADRRLSRLNLLRITSKLSDWLSTGKIKLADFERDKRFDRLCKSLGGNVGHAGDLATVLAVTGDYEASRLVNKLNGPQSIKVMTSLAQKRRRSTSLIKTLSLNILRETEPLDLKKCSDLLYALALLNYPDLTLIEKICSNVRVNLEGVIDKSATVGSVATSLGMLKYKDEKLLDLLGDWMVAHERVCRTQDVAALVVTAATLGHDLRDCSRFSQIPPLEFVKPSCYLEYVWALVILDCASEAQIRRVLTSDFVESLKTDEAIPFASHKRLCNVSGYARMKGYEGASLSKETTESLQSTYSKDKRRFVDALMDALKSLLSSEINVKKSCNSDMGFLFDASMVLDDKCNPYPVDSDLNVKGKKLMRVAVLALDYHDFCRNTSEPLGYIKLYKRLLESQGYRVALVPYSEFNVQDKLVYRVQFLEKKLKAIVCE